MAGSLLAFGLLQDLDAVRSQTASLLLCDLGAPGWGSPGFRTVLCWFCPHRLGYGDRVMCYSVLLCLLFAIPIPGMMQCHHLSHSAGIVFGLFSTLTCGFCF